MLLLLDSLCLASAILILGNLSLKAQVLRMWYLWISLNLYCMYHWCRIF